jgi:hypothetical protein
MSKLHLLIKRRRERLVLPRTKLLMQALQQADDAHAQLRAAQAAIDAIVHASMLPDAACEDGISALTAAELTELQAAWAEFGNEGGVTATDFRDWLDGKPIARTNSSPRGKRHLRLVATRPGLPGLRIRPAPVDAA